MIEVGQKMEWTRTIAAEDVRRFGEVTGDQGLHHVREDAAGRLMAQGLLTASLPTKLGGDLNFIARTMTFEFLKPVYAGDTLTCRGLVDSVEREPSRLRVSFSFVVTRQDGEPVMRGASHGIILAAG